MAFFLENSELKMRGAERSWSLREVTRDRHRPFYVYNLDAVLERARAFRRAPAAIHYAMKANAHPRLLGLLRDEGLGVDVVSLGELQKALALGFQPNRIIFSGVGKDHEELSFALAAGVLQINVESFEELRLLAELARGRGVSAPVALRINIHLEAPTHKHVQTATEESKFGLDNRLLPEVLRWLKVHPEIRLEGLAVHIGSQIMDLEVFATMARQTGELFRGVKAEGFPLQRLDLGGGLGIDYRGGEERDLAQLESYLQAVSQHETGARLVLEPGRFLVGRAGALLAKVVYVKQGLSRRFVILNAGMNCLMRPALYQSYHRIEPVERRAGEWQRCSVVGPLCESTDTFAQDRELPPVEPGDWVAILDAGAYGAVMANTYNESPLPEQWSVLGGAWEVL